MYTRGNYSSLYLVLIIVLLKSCSQTFCFDYHSHMYSPYYNEDHYNVWDNALNIMSYHRNKMNEYLCKKYVAREIVEGMQNQSFNENINRRVRESLSSSLARESLLKDPGSQKYKDWLSRSSTLEDIYRQFDHPENEHKEGHLHGNMHQDFGHGYTFVDPKHVYSKPIDFGQDHHYHFGHHDDSHYGTYSEESHDEKGIKLKELFHFALTAIAFLAFATYMVEIIVCLMNTQNTAPPDYVIVPTNTGGTAAGGLKNEFETPEGLRHERSLQLDPVSIEILNNMSSRVLSSIEAMAILHEDGGRCLRRVLCQNTKYSKNLPGSQKIWLPIWSFGSSWIGGKLSKAKNSSAATRALKYLQATVLGLGTKECHALYPKCDDKMRRRRK